MNTVGVRRVRFQNRRPGYHTKDDFCKRRYHATTRSNLFFCVVFPKPGCALTSQCAATTCLRLQASFESLAELGGYGVLGSPAHFRPAFPKRLRPKISMLVCHVLGAFNYLKLCRTGISNEWKALPSFVTKFCQKSTKLL